MPYVFYTRPATTVIHTLSLHHALPISEDGIKRAPRHIADRRDAEYRTGNGGERETNPGVVVDSLHPGVRDRTGKGVEEHHRSEEHTSELQSLRHLVCRLLLEKKKKQRR